MKIGIDCREFYDSHLNLGAGIPRYTYHLVKNLLEQDQKNDYILFFYSDLSPEAIHRVRGGNSRVKIIKLFRSSSRLPLVDNHWKFAKALRSERPDLTIFPANAMPLFYRRRSILIMHDLAIYLHPEWFPDRQWLSTKILVPRAIRRAEKIVSISESTKHDLIKLFKTAENKISVIYPGVAEQENYLEEETAKVIKKFDIRGGYVCFVGTIEPRKNILNLIKAFSGYIFENEESGVNLVIAGIKGWKFGSFFRELNEINKRFANSRIKYVGKVSDRERDILIQKSRAFIFPSLYEGFGFPVLEAMSLGVPVITSDNSSLREVAADSAYLLVDPEDVNELRRAIKKTLEDKVWRQQAVKRGLARAAEFTWDKTVSRLLELINSER